MVLEEMSAMLCWSRGTKPSRVRWSSGCFLSGKRRDEKEEKEVQVLSRKS